MANKRFFLALSLFALAALCLHAQESGPLVHRLSWQPVEYASHYEVVVEVRTLTNEWIELTRKTSEVETFIDYPLFVGNFRFRVSAYDLLGKPGSTTDWVYFEVRSPVAEQPPQAGQQAAAGVPESSASDSAPEEKDKSIFRLELLAAPFIILPFSDFNEIYSTSPVQPLGFALRFTVLPFVTPVGTFGFDLLPSWNFLANDILHTSRYTHIINGQASLVWQIRPFNRSTALDFRLGGGLSYISSRFVFNDGLSTNELNTWNPSIIGGVSFLSFLNKSVFLNVGFDYYHIFTLDNVAMNYLRPMIGLGWWF